MGDPKLSDGALVASSLTLTDPSGLGSVVITSAGIQICGPRADPVISFADLLAAVRHIKDHP